MGTLIAVTNLNLSVAIDLMKKHNCCTVLYYKSKMPSFLYKILRKKHQLQEFNFKNNPDYIENVENEKRIFKIAQLIADSRLLSKFSKGISAIMSIGEAHIRCAIIKHIIELISEDITLFSLVSDKYPKGCMIEYRPQNYALLSHAPDFTGVDIARSGLPDLLYLKSAVYLTLWPVNIVKFFINRLFKEPERKSIKIVFRQIYSKRFGHDPEFDAFYRYFKKRDDVIYHCVKKNDEMYNHLLSDGKPVFTNKDLRLDLKRAFSLCGKFFKLIFLHLSSALPQKIFMWRVMLSIFKEYAVTESTLAEFLPRYFMRIRPELYENHPVITGLCERFDASHIGYEHGPSAYFCAHYALTDFHYFGVMGKNSMNEIYKDYRPGIKWSVIGPVVAEVAYEVPVPAHGDKIITLIADYYIYSWGIFPYKDYFNEVFLPLVDFMKEKKDVTLIYRLKIFRNKGRGQYAENVCRRNNIKCNIEYGSSGNDISSFSSYTIKRSGLVVIRGNSRMAWECLSLGKKMIVYPNKWVRHPLESFSPNLVVRSGKEFREKAEWLWNMPYDEYIEKTDHIVNEIGKRANGSMAQEFFEDYVGIDR